VVAGDSRRLLLCLEGFLLVTVGCRQFWVVVAEYVVVGGCDRL